MPEELDDSTRVSRADQVPSARVPQSGLQFSLGSLFWVTMIVCVVLGIYVPVIRAQRTAMQRTCMNNLKQMALALNNYYDVNKMFPWAVTFAEDGTPMHSWRVRIRPYLEQNPFYDRYDFRQLWNGPRNRLLGEYMYCPAPYSCPSAPRTQDRRYTNYVMLIDDRPGKPNGPPNRPGSAPPSFDDKSAVIIIEIADSDIHWMEPRDVLLSELSMKINDRSKRSLSSYHGGACIAHADGTVEILDEATTEERVRELLAQ
jgi:hypothetical protein